MNPAKTERRVRELREEADRLTFASHTSQGFAAWQVAVRAALQSAFGQVNVYLEHFDRIWWSPAVTYSDTSPSVYEEAFNLGLAEAKGILDAALRDLSDRDDPSLLPAVQPVQTSPPPESIQAVAAAELNLWPRWLRITAVCLIAVAVATYLIWTSLPEDVRKRLLHPKEQTNTLSPCTPPTAETRAADNIGSRIAFIYGTASANATKTWFDFDTTPALRYSIAPLDGRGIAQDLQPNTTYYYRYVAQNTCGTYRGNILQFVTNSEMVQPTTAVTPSQPPVATDTAGTAQVAPAPSQTIASSVSSSPQTTPVPSPCGHPGPVFASPPDHSHQPKSFDVELSLHNPCTVSTVNLYYGCLSWPGWPNTWDFIHAWRHPLSGPAGDIDLDHHVSLPRANGECQLRVIVYFTDGQHTQQDLAFYTP